MNSIRRNHADRALRIFLLHYYSADWIRNLLLQQRVKSVLHEYSIVTTAQREDALFLCLKASIRLFPTARGLKEIDDIVAKITSLRVALMSGSSSGEGNEYRFAIFNKNFCIETRYRMSLLLLADNARECGNDSLASLWVIAATAKLDHVSAWQAYCAAKEEESRLLNYITMAQYWQSEKSYMGDVKEKIFDRAIFSMYYHHEAREKEREFRRFLHSKVDPSLHSTVDTCDFKGDAFLRIYCNVKANSLEKHRSNRLWMLANDLYGKQVSSFTLTKKVISISLRLEDILERMLSAAKDCRLNCSYNLPFASVWMKASRFLEDVNLKLKLLIGDQVANATNSNDPKLVHLIERISRLIGRVDDCFSYEPTLQMMKYCDSILHQVIDALPILTSHPEHSFPDLRNLLTTYRKDFERTNEQYMEVLEEIMRHHIQMVDPSVEQLKQFEKIKEERQRSISLLDDHNLFLQAFLKRTLPSFDRLKDEIHAKVLYSFADSYYTVNINGCYDSTPWRNISIRESYFKRFDELFSLAVEASKNDMNSSIHLELLDISFDSIKYRIVPVSNDHTLLQLLEKANYHLKHSLTSKHAIEASKRLKSLEVGKTFYEASRLIMKGQEIRKTKGPHIHHAKKREQRKRKLINLYFDAAKWTEQVAISISRSESDVGLCRLEAMKYMEAIHAFEGGDEKMAFEYEQQALQITLR